MEAFKKYFERSETKNSAQYYYYCKGCLHHENDRLRQLHASQLARADASDRLRRQGELLAEGALAIPL